MFNEPNGASSAYPVISRPLEANAAGEVSGSNKHDASVVWLKNMESSYMQMRMRVNIVINVVPIKDNPTTPARILCYPDTGGRYER